MIHFRPHGVAGEHPTDDSGRVHTTISVELAQQYADSARADGESASVTAGVSSDSAKMDMLVTNTDSVGLEYPTRKYAPGY
jgi:hypothetical protein